MRIQHTPVRTRTSLYLNHCLVAVETENCKIEHKMVILIKLLSKDEETCAQNLTTMMQMHAHLALVDLALRS